LKNASENTIYCHEAKPSDQSMTVEMAKARRFSSIIGTSGCGFETPRVQKHFFPSNREEYFTLSGENKEIVSNIPTMKYLPRLALPNPDCPS
jgi:hypothetical protein